MFRVFQVTKYQVRKITYYAKAGLCSAVAVIICGNIITAFIKDKIRVDTSSYTVKNGFPLFTSEKDYINILRSYPRNPGVMFTVHEVKSGESFWDISRLYNISLDTIIAANPFLKTLAADEGSELIIPLEDGVLMPFSNIIDVWKMGKILGYREKIRGDYKPTLFRLISTDDIRFVFFKNAKPEILNDTMAKLYNFRRTFQAPVEGFFSSLYGNRVDPFHNGIAFHDGIDIMAKYGDPIKPAREGMVLFTGWREGLGKTIVIQHPDGYATVYGHCSNITTEKGTWVGKDDVIGTVGSTGRSTGPHLHFIIMRHGLIIDPIKLIW